MKNQFHDIGRSAKKGKAKALPMSSFASGGFGGASRARAAAESAGGEEAEAQRQRERLEAIKAEARSIAGYSGTPVVVDYPVSANKKTKPPGAGSSGKKKPIWGGSTFPKTLTANDAAVAGGRAPPSRSLPAGSILGAPPLGTAGAPGAPTGRPGDFPTTPGKQRRDCQVPKMCVVEGCDKQSQGGRCLGMCKAHFTKANPDAPNPMRARQCQYEDCTKYAQGGCGGMCRAHFTLTNPGAPPKIRTPKGTGPRAGAGPRPDSLGGRKRAAVGEAFLPRSQQLPKPPNPKMMSPQGATYSDFVPSHGRGGGLTPKSSGRKRQIPKTCSFEGCEKQSQGNRCGGMCKAHFTMLNPNAAPTHRRKKKGEGYADEGAAPPSKKQKLQAESSDFFDDRDEAAAMSLLNRSKGGGGDDVHEDHAAAMSLLNRSPRRGNKKGSGGGVDGQDEQAGLSLLNLARPSSPKSGSGEKVGDVEHGSKGASGNSKEGSRKRAKAPGHASGSGLGGLDTGDFGGVSAGAPAGSAASSLYSSLGLGGGGGAYGSGPDALAGATGGYGGLGGPGMGGGAAAGVAPSVEEQLMQQLQRQLEAQQHGAGYMGGMGGGLGGMNYMNF